MGDCPKNFFEDLFFWRKLAAVSLVLGLEYSCSWPREGLSSKRLFLASDFFCVLVLEPCVLDSTSGYCYVIAAAVTFLSWLVYLILDPIVFIVTLSRKAMYYLEWNLSVERQQDIENPWAPSGLQPWF